MDSSKMPERQSEALGVIRTGTAGGLTIIISDFFPGVL